MIVRAWRITKGKYAAKAFTGEGAELAGGRWNSPGVPVVYAASNESLAILEMLVHIQSERLLTRYVVFEVNFDHRHVLEIAPRALPKLWRRSPPSRAVQTIGDRWVSEAASAVLRVPSTVVPTEWNYLLNPLHPDYRSLKIGPKRRVRLDSRLTRLLHPSD